MGLNMRQQFEVPVISVEYSYKFVRESYQVSNILIYLCTHQVLLL